MEQFTNYILCEMTAEQFIALLRDVDMPYEEFLRLSKHFRDAENEMIYLHVVYPNAY